LAQQLAVIKAAEPFLKGIPKKGLKKGAEWKQQQQREKNFSLEFQTF